MITYRARSYDAIVDDIHSSHIRMHDVMASHWAREQVIPRVMTTWKPNEAVIMIIDPPWPQLLAVTLMLP